jgi:hypothetical protein
MTSTQFFQHSGRAKAMKRIIFELMALSLFLGVIGQANAQDYEFTTTDFPGATETDAHGINPRGDIVGGYALAGDIYPPQPPAPLGTLPRAFLLSRGQFSTIDVPGATYSFASRNNARGDVVGWYGTDDGVTHGFLLSGGQYTTFDFSAIVTSAAGINSRGDIVGHYESTSGNGHGYGSSHKKCNI